MRERSAFPTRQALRCAPSRSPPQPYSRPSPVPPSRPRTAATAKLPVARSCRATREGRIRARCGPAIPRRRRAPDRRMAGTCRPRARSPRARRGGLADMRRTGLIKIAAAVTAALVTTTAFAQSRPSSTAMTCQQARGFVASRGAAVLGTGGMTYDRVVRACAARRFGSGTGLSVCTTLNDRTP